MLRDVCVRAERHLSPGRDGLLLPRLLASERGRGLGNDSRHSSTGAGAPEKHREVR